MRGRSRRLPTAGSCRTGTRRSRPSRSATSCAAPRPGRGAAGVRGPRPPRSPTPPPTDVRPCSCRTGRSRGRSGRRAGPAGTSCGTTACAGSRPSPVARLYAPPLCARTARRRTPTGGRSTPSHRAHAGRRRRRPALSARPRACCGTARPLAPAPPSRVVCPRCPVRRAPGARRPPAGTPGTRSTPRCPGPRGQAGGSPRLVRRRGPPGRSAGSRRSGRTGRRRARRSPGPACRNPCPGQRWRRGL